MIDPTLPTKVVDLEYYIGYYKKQLQAASPGSPNISMYQQRINSYTIQLAAVKAALAVGVTPVSAPEPVRPVTYTPASSSMPAAPSASLAFRDYVLPGMTAQDVEDVLSRVRATDVAQPETDVATPWYKKPTVLLGVAVAGIAVVLYFLIGRKQRNS